MKSIKLNTLKYFIHAFLVISIATITTITISPAQAQETLRISAIPDESPTELQRKFKPLSEYLSTETSMRIEFTPVTDYAAAVAALAAEKIDMAWLGGFTYVQDKN